MAIVKKTKKKAPEDFPIIGIGASAGGLAALETFFSAMPTGGDYPGMAFVLVQHQAPDHKSMLTEIIQRCTQMPVFEVEDGVVVQPNCIYTIPPDQDLTIVKGILKLQNPSESKAQRLPIDFFFQALALDQHEHAVGIVLSGSGNDGTLGVQAIKEAGGMIMVQKAGSAEYDGMPSSVIATGLADFMLSPAEMPTSLIAYVSHSQGKRVRMSSHTTPDDEEALKNVFTLLCSQTGNEFSQYKPSIIRRRIERRMTVHQIDTMGSYVQYMQQAPDEVEALYRDLLIGVTHFFRDVEAFKNLAELGISQLIMDHPSGRPIRVWIPGCSTGEEAYSIAILIHEQLEFHNLNQSVQIFATDLDSQAISKARRGIYASDSVADISPERLTRYFIAETKSTKYRIQKIIRDMVVFSVQNVIKDPPFSNVDLISCRNLLIYMDNALQQKLIILFHYVLNPKGLLFLGTSESIGKQQELFSTLDNKSKLYQRKKSSPEKKRTELAQIIPIQSVREPVPTEAPESKKLLDALNLMAPKEPKGKKKRTAVADKAVLALNTDVNTPTLVVHGNDSELDSEISALQHALYEKNEALVSAHKACKASNEELKSSVEEMQSLNEELLSTNELFETSKEELLSINEELIKVNSELLSQLTELTQANNDMNNLLASTGIATIFVDLKLRILRFTPLATSITNMIPSDIGRPVGHIASNLVGYTLLAADAKAVLKTLTPRERQVQAIDGRWYTLRIQPYRTLKNVIEGAVISFVDITDMVKIRKSLKKANEQLRQNVEVTHEK